VTPVRKKTKRRAKSTPSKGRAPKKTASAARKKTSAKTPPRKAATTKAGAPKVKAKPKAPARPTAPVRESPKPEPAKLAEVRAPAARRRTSRARPKAPRAPLPTPATPAGVEPRSRLGGKHVCFECGAKFYDLNRPEPLCPKCGADQRNQPARELKLKTPAGQSRRSGGRAMAPLLVDDEEETVVHDEPEVDLALGVVDPADVLVDDEEPDDSEAEEP
jgi:hypothetical protein